MPSPSVSAFGEPSSVAGRASCAPSPIASPPSLVLGALPETKRHPTAAKAIHAIRTLTRYNDRPVNSAWIAWLAVACGNTGAPRQAPPSRPADAARADLFDPTGPIVTATEVSVGGVSLGLAIDHARLVERLRGVPAAATLAFTGDAHADLVIEVARTLVETGHARIELVTAVGGRRVTICNATAAAPDATAIQIVIEGGKIDLGLSAVLTVLHPLFDDAHLADDLTAPFFDKATAIEITSAPAITGNTLSAVLGVACKKLSAVRFGDFATLEAARKGVRTLPLCRKLIAQTPATTYDPKSLVEGLPDLYAMDLCYNLRAAPQSDRDGHDDTRDRARRHGRQARCDRSGP